MDSILFNNRAEQRRVRSLVTHVGQVLFNPVVEELINTSGGRKPGLGWGLAEYRCGSDCLSTTPSSSGEKPAEISFYPEIAQLGINGAIYWHGEGSNALLRGKIMGLYLDLTCENGYYTNYFEVRNVQGTLDIGRVDKQSDTLLAIQLAEFNALEASVQDLAFYVKSFQ